ncbi:MAG: DUF368 domain-containing protein [Bacteroidota bacterium]
MNPLYIFLKGVAMGAANVIPGVSGGTMAFITGIYERLINALKHIDIKSIKLLLSGKFKAFAERVDFMFLVYLFLGVFISILSLAKLLEWALDRYEVYTLSFFFGLILASIFAVAKQISQVDLSVVVSFVIGTAIAISIAFLPPAQESDSFIYMILCGVVAVCSMILPGLSGSYILILMGNYLLVLRAVSAFEFTVLIPLLIGCVIGLITLSRLLSYLFNQFENATISALSGFVVGSLLIIWPWQTKLTASFNGKEKVVGRIWNLPDMEGPFFLALFLILLGFLLVIWMERQSKKE